MLLSSIILEVFSKRDKNKPIKKEPKPYTTKIDGIDKNDESLLERLIFENPELFPVEEIAGESTWIPLATQVHIEEHGTLDILATDNNGNIYVVECKLKYNVGDMKTIRGQITDYAAGLWSKAYSNNPDDAKFDNFWAWFCTKIEKNSDAKQKLEVILENAGVVDVEQTIDMMQKNFQDNKMILIYAVDRITQGIRDAVEWHNIAVNPEHNYPTFALEVRKYEEEEGELIVAETFPLNLKELQRKIGTKSKRVKNDKQSWTDALKKKNLEEENKIIEFADKLEELVKKDGGEIDWGSGAINPRMMPKFTNFPNRSALGLFAGGELMMQYHLIQGVAEYEDVGKEWEKRTREINEINTEVENSRSKGDVRLKIKTWHTHSDKILSILEELFVKK